jgi:hypothetical protein
MMGKKIAPFGSSERFIRAHVRHQDDDCLPWPFRLNDRGYGLATIGGKQKGAHRWMCILAHGEPELIWRHAAHRCGNPACVNPQHLRWATHRENMFDKELHGTVSRGERNGRTTLTEADVIAIRLAPAKLAPLMEKYGLSKHAISRIRSGKRWAHVGGPRTSRQRGAFPMCWNGHPYDAKNTHWTKDGYRQCRACGAANARARRAKHGVVWSEPKDEGA